MISTQQKQLIGRLIGIGAGIVIIVVVLVAFFSAGGSDEQQIKKSIQKSVKAWNEKDYRTEYERMTPNARKKVSYEEFKDYAQASNALLLLLLGPGKVETSDINVRVEEEWAYASYKIKKEGEIIDSIDEYIFRKVKGKWYDVAESPMEPGYNREDLPPDRR